MPFKGQEEVEKFDQWSVCVMEGWGGEGGVLQYSRYWTRKIFVHCTLSLYIRFGVNGCLHLWPHPQLL